MTLGVTTGQKYFQSVQIGQRSIVERSPSSLGVLQYGGRRPRRDCRVACGLNGKDKAIIPMFPYVVALIAAAIIAASCGCN